MANNRPIDQTAMPTNTNNHPPKTTPGLPAMRFEGGNVPIYLSADPREALLLHEDLLCALNRWFEACLRRPWTKSQRVVDPSTGEARKVAGFALVAREGTFFLDQGGEFQSEEYIKDGVPRYSTLFVDNKIFSKFESAAKFLSSNGVWDRLMGADLKIMIALIYGIPITLEDIIANTEELQEYTRGESCHSAALVGHRLMDILALAEMHECFDVVSTKIAEMLLAYPQIWDLTRYEPPLFGQLGKILECEEVFTDAVHHILSADWYRTHGRLADLLDLEESEVRELVSTHLSAREEAEGELKRTLRDLGLAKTDEVYYCGIKQHYLTTCINAFTHRRRKQAKKNQRVEVLALSISSQLRTQQFEKNSTYVVYRRDGRPKPRDVDEFNVVLSKIIDAAKSENPCSLFGHKVPEGYISIFGKESIDLDHLKAKLASMIHSAVNIIINWGHGRGARCGIIKGSRLTWARMQELVPITPWEKAKQDKLADQASAAPGLVSKPSAQKSEIKVPAVSMEPASEEWLAALGLLEGPTKDDEAEDEENGET